VLSERHDLCAPLLGEAAVQRELRRGARFPYRGKTTCAPPYRGRRLFSVSCAVARVPPTEGKRLNAHPGKGCGYLQP